MHSPTLGRLFSCIEEAQVAGALTALERSQTVTDDDVNRAWQVLSPAGEETVTKSELMGRLAAFHPAITHQEVNYLAGQGSFSKEKLAKLLLHSTKPPQPLKLDNEAWRVLDSHGRGTVDFKHILRLLQQVPGSHHLDDDDIKLVRLLMGLEEDATIVTKQAWENLGTWKPRMEELTPAQRRILAKRERSSGGTGLTPRTPGLSPRSA